MRLGFHFFGSFSLVFSLLGETVFYRVVETSADYPGQLQAGYSFSGSETNGALAAFGDGRLMCDLETGAWHIRDTQLFDWGSFDWWFTGTVPGLLTNAALPDRWIEIAAVPGNSVSGRVTDSGLPVSGAVVRAWADVGGYWVLSGDYPRAVTGSDGRYTLPECYSGEHFLTVGYFAGGAWCEKPYTGAVYVAGNVAGVDWAIERACSYSVRYAGLYGAPAAGASVRVWRRSVDKTYVPPVYPEGYVPDTFGLPYWVSRHPDYRPPHWAADGAWWWGVGASELRTDQDGRLSLTGLEAGWYLFRVEGDRVAPFEYEVWLRSSVSELRGVDLLYETDWRPYVELAFRSFSWVDMPMPFGLPPQRLYNFGIVGGVPDVDHWIDYSYDLQAWNELGAFVPDQWEYPLSVGVPGPRPSRIFFRLRR